MGASRRFLSFEAVSLIIAFAILAAAGLVTIRTEEQRRESGGWVRHTLQVEGALYRLDGAIHRAESDERGFLITQDRSYSSARDNFGDRTEKELDQLGALVADNPAQIERLAKLRPILMERLALLQKKLDLMESDRFDEAAAIIRDGRGKALTDQIDALIGQMIAEEDDIHRRRDVSLSQATDSLQVAIGVMIVLLAGVGIFAVFLAEKQIRALRQSGESLRLAYNELIEEATRRAALEGQLRQSQKLEALGHLAGGIAHDFNNMLGVIVASLNIMRRKLPKNEGGLDQLIDSAMDGAERAAQLVRRLLAFSRIQPLNPAPLDPSHLVTGMSTILRRALGANIALASRVGADVWPVKVDPNELENLILNLAVNARDAMPEGGRLTIETANTTLDEAYASQNAEVKPGDYVRLTVSDTGHGMPPDVLAKAFDPFFTTKPVGKGTGLGLSQAHGFVRQSGGSIKISSEVGRGTTVKLYLPRYCDATARPHSTTESPAPEAFVRGGPEEIILIVEDDETARRVTAQGVRELGYSVLEAATGKDAIQIIRARADILLLVTDVVMPEMDGAQLAREAVFRRHALHVLFITGYASHAIHNGILDPDVNLLTKPFTLAQLSRKIRDALDGRADLPKGKAV